MTARRSPRASLDPEEFRDVIGHFATGVTVIAAVDGDELFGTTASAVTSLSLEPPMLLICMSQESSTGACVSRVGRFAVNILNEHQGDLAQRFATKAPGKFEGVDVLTGRYGQPLLAQALAHVECRVVEEVSGGSHSVFIAEVRHASAGIGTPLAYYRGQFGRLLLEESVDDAIEDAIRGLCASEIGAAAMTLGRGPGGELAQLRELVESCETSETDAPARSVQDLLKADRMFHAQLVRLAGSQSLAAYHERLDAAVPRVRWLASRDGFDEQFVHDNRRILDAYERRDLAAAADAIRSRYLAPE